MKKPKPGKRRQAPRRKPTKASKAHNAPPPVDLVDLEEMAPLEETPSGMAWVEITISTQESIEGLECLAPEDEVQRMYADILEKLEPYLSPASPQG